MSLFSSIQIAGNALSAAQIGLQVTGNNIANANTPDYIREEAVLVPAPTQQIGDLLLGLGVDIAAIIQKKDDFLEQRLRGAVSDLANGQTQEQTHLELEAVVGELSDTDLSTSLGNFFGSIHDILNQPESIAVRNLAVLQGRTLTGDINRLSTRVRTIRKGLNDRVINIADDINRLLSDIAKLNVQIVTTEGGDTSASDAVGLRDQRIAALKKLAGLIDIRVSQQPNGAVTVISGGDFLVAESFFREVKAITTPNEGLPLADIVVAETDKPIDSSSGELAGLLASRDEILGGFLDQLDDLAGALIFEFNKIYTGGQGLVGYGDLTSEFTVDATDAALDQAGLKFTPVNGSFQVLMHNKQTELTKTTDVFVRLNGLEDDTTLEDLQAALNAIDGLSAEVTSSRGLRVRADSPNVELAFAADTSGVLAALGLGTFFSGSTASDVGVSQVVRDDPAKFAASRSGIGQDTENAVELAGFLDKPLSSRNNASLADLYDRLTGETTQAASVAKAVAEGFRAYQQTLEGQRLAISGVSVDEEAIKLISYQRMFQAAANYISKLDELLNMLMRL